jgi:hypothetical protein
MPLMPAACSSPPIARRRAEAAAQQQASSRIQTSIDTTDYGRGKSADKQITVD